MREDVQRILDSSIELWNTGNVDIAKRVYTDRAERHDPNQPEPVRGLEALSRYVAEVRTGFPDFRVDRKEEVVEGDRVASHWTATGTHKGEFRGIPPTGKRVSVSGLALARIENGRIAEERVYWDRLALFEQLGVSPQTQARGAGR